MVRNLFCEPRAGSWVKGFPYPHCPSPPLLILQTRTPLNTNPPKNLASCPMLRLSRQKPARVVSPTQHGRKRLRIFVLLSPQSSRRDLSPSRTSSFRAFECWTDNLFVPGISLLYKHKKPRAILTANPPSQDWIATQQAKPQKRVMDHSRIHHQRRNTKPPKFQDCKVIQYQYSYISQFVNITVAFSPIRSLGRARCVPNIAFSLKTITTPSRTTTINVSIISSHSKIGLTMVCVQPW